MHEGAWFECTMERAWALCVGEHGLGVLDNTVSVAERRAVSGVTAVSVCVCMHWEVA